MKNSRENFVMKKIAFFLLCTLGATVTHAETTSVVSANAPISAPAKIPASAPANQAPVLPVAKPVALKPAMTTAPSAVPNTAQKTLPGATPSSPAAAIFEPTLPQAPVVTLEQRRQEELLANAERIDKTNRELLAKNQELQVQNENMTLQNNVLKRDKSSEGVWKGALAVIVGFLMGWYFSSSSRRKSSW
jgi:hypothetical protein